MFFFQCINICQVPRGCWKPRPRFPRAHEETGTFKCSEITWSAEVFNRPRGTCQMLMYWKQMFNPYVTRIGLFSNTATYQLVQTGSASFVAWHPAGIWCENDVVLTSMRRDDVASTLIRRHFHTKCQNVVLTSMRRDDVASTLIRRHFHTKCQNVVFTSMRRDDVASTLIRRHFHTKCPLGRFSLG